MHRAATSLVTLLLTCFVLSTTVPGADFPPAAQLPVQAELPDPLVLFNGTRVTTAQQWKEQRRPELKALFEHYMYGAAPAAPKIEAVVLRTDAKFMDGRATLKEVQINFGPQTTPKLHLLLIVPNGRQQKAPVFLGMNFCGNHTVTADPHVLLPAVWMPAYCTGVVDNKPTEAARGSQKEVWNADLIISRGYALATFFSGDIDPDRPDFTDGVHPHFLKAGQTQPGPHEWGTIAAWAWGYSRAIDYLVTDPDLDAKRIAAVGHSRNGKTTLLAAAFDERIALAIPHQAGCGGTAPSRHKVGEQVKQINDRFPHWFSDSFTAFNDQVERLPFDQHCLVAMCAPRPVLLSNAIEDTWADPDGQFRVLQAAEPVYKLLGAPGTEPGYTPAPGKLMNARLGYFLRLGKHSMNREDWQAFLDYADKQLGKP